MRAVEYDGTAKDYKTGRTTEINISVTVSNDEYAALYDRGSPQEVYTTGKVLKEAKHTILSNGPWTCTVCPAGLPYRPHTANQDKQQRKLCD